MAAAMVLTRRTLLAIHAQKLIRLFNLTHVEALQGASELKDGCEYSSGK